jgi:hypothetical protein
MKSRPILFSAPMVRALLEGRKTQTRRIVKHRHPFEVDDGIIDSSDAKWPYFPEYVYGEPGVIPMRCPYGVRGDRLWVKETHAVNVPGCERGLSYRADHNDPKGDGPANPMRWIPSIHMRRGYSRLTLEVTDVRVERLQDISEEDAEQEGVAWSDGGSILDWRDYLAPDSRVCKTARDSFRTLWQSINGAESWDANPFVWAVSFRKVVAQ